MDLGYSSSSDDAVNVIIEKVKSEGIFDAFRKECVADVDTKPAYQNLRQRVEDFVTQFLSGRVWTADLSKNALRDMLRLQINQSSFLKSGVERVVNQLVMPRVDKFLKPHIETVVISLLGIDPNEEGGKYSEREQQQRPVSASLSSLIPDLPSDLHPLDTEEPFLPVLPPLPPLPPTSFPGPPMPPSSQGQPLLPPLPEDHQPPPPPSDDDMDISDEDMQAGAEVPGCRSLQTTDLKSGSSRNDGLACGDGADKSGEIEQCSQRRARAPDVASLAQGLADYLAHQDVDTEHLNSAAGASTAFDNECMTRLIGYDEDTSELGDNDEEEDSIAGSMESAEPSSVDREVHLEREIAGEPEKLTTYDSTFSQSSKSDTDVCHDAHLRAGEAVVPSDLPAAAGAVSGRRESRRNRTRNRKYTSGEFTSIFSQKKQLLCDSYVVDAVEEGVVEEVVTTDDPLVSISLSQDHPMTNLCKDDEEHSSDARSVLASASKTKDDGQVKEDHSSSIGSVGDSSSPQQGSRPSSAHSHESLSSSSHHVVRLAARSKSDSGSSADVRPSSSATRTATQRYDASDLYKPRMSHRKPVESPTSPVLASVVGGPSIFRGGRRRKRTQSSGDAAVVEPASILTRAESSSGMVELTPGHAGQPNPRKQQPSSASPNEAVCAADISYDVRVESQVVGHVASGSQPTGLDVSAQMELLHATAGEACHSEELPDRTSSRASAKDSSRSRKSQDKSARVHSEGYATKKSRARSSHSK